MENTKEDISFEVLEIVLKIAGMIVAAMNTIVQAIDLAERFRHQKSNRPDQS